MSLQIKLKTDPKVLRKENMEKVRNFHAKFLKDIGESDPLVVCKTPFSSSSGERVVGLFESELRKKKDIYIEFTNYDNEPSDDNRTLYKWRFNANFEEYERLTNNDIVRILIPTDELVKVKAYPPEDMVRRVLEEGKQGMQSPNNEKTNKSNSESVNDAPFSDLTIRDIYAIYHNKPVSNKLWLNLLINGKK
jgi:hypothetical protein